MPKTFGQLVQQLREERGLSVYALAQRAGLSDQAIHDLERSDRQPSLETARRLAAGVLAGLAFVAVAGLSKGWDADTLRQARAGVGFEAGVSCAVGGTFGWALWRSLRPRNGGRPE